MWRWPSEGSTQTGVSSYQASPGGDADFGVQRGGEEDEEQQGEEEGRAADKLKEVESGAGGAAAHHLLQDEGHEGQQLTERRETSGTSFNFHSTKKITDMKH